MSFGQFNSSNAIVPTASPMQGQQQYHHHHQSQQQQQQRRAGAGGRPSTKRQPHNGAKSHKILDEASTQNLFVARLPRSFGNDDLLFLFAEFHPTSATVMMDVASGKSKGFGFVTFDSAEEGQLALEVMKTRTLQQPATHTTAITSEMSDYSLEIKPSTFNGQRIVVESRYVYFRNFPAQVLSPRHSIVSTTQLEEVTAFFAHQFGCSVQAVQFHGGSSKRATSPSTTLTADGAEVAPAFLVSFATQAQAQTAMTRCHGKVLFPQYTTTPVMAKYADMTTVKLMDRQSPRVSRQGSCATSVASTPKSAGSRSFPTLPAGIQIAMEVASHPFPNVMVPSQPQSLGCSPSRAGGRSPPVAEFLAPDHGFMSSMGSSMGPSGSFAPSSTASVSSQCQSQPSEPAQRPFYRNDPYNTSGYVMVSSSSSDCSTPLSQCSSEGTFYQY